MNLCSAYSNLPEEITAPDKQGVQLCACPSITELSHSRFRDVTSRGLPSRQLTTTYNPTHLAIRGSIFHDSQENVASLPWKKNPGPEAEAAACSQNKQPLIASKTCLYHMEGQPLDTNCQAAPLSHQAEVRPQAAASSRDLPLLHSLRNTVHSTRLGTHFQDEPDQGPRVRPVLEAWCVEFTKGLRKVGTLVATISSLPECNLKSYLDYNSRP